MLKKITTGIIFAMAVVWAGNVAAADRANDKKIDQAIKFMREIDLAKIYKLPKEQRNQKAVQLDKAWQTLVGGGQPSVEKLKKAYREMVASKKKNDFFALGASAIIWQIAKENEADFIAEVWSNADLTKNYNYVFMTAFQAARTRNPKVLPILKAVLKEQKGKFPLAMHAMVLRWPQTIKFVWGAYGYDGLKELHKVLKESNDPNTQASAIYLLGDSYYMPALEDIRKLTTSKDQRVRQYAYGAIGRFNRPEDAKWLLADAKKGKPQAIVALAHMSNKDVLDFIDPYFTSNDEEKHSVALYACYAIPCRKSVDQIIACYEGKKKTTISKKSLKYILDDIFRKIKSNLKDYKKLDDAGKNKLFASLPKQTGVTHKIEKKKITHDQFVKAVKDWQSQKRIRGNKEVTSEQAFAVATPDDIPMLIDLKARIYERLSDEALYDIRYVDKLIRNILQRELRK